jgi:hypothetical protein
MLSVEVEQRVNVKFLAKLGNFATETYSVLMEVYGDEVFILKFLSGSKDLKRERE